MPLFSTKLPRVALPFWVLTGLCAIVAESTSDVGEGRTGGAIVAGATIALVATLGIQFRLDRYVPPIYWATVALTGVVAGHGSDELTDRYGVSRVAGGVALCLALIVSVWWSSERRVRAESITTRTRERLYWLTLLMTFALGTSLTDFIADGSLTGYWPATAFFSALVMLVAVMRLALRMDGATAFWSGYMLIQALGASIAKEIAQPGVDGGIGLGTTRTSLLALVAVAGAVVLATAKGRGERPLAARTLGEDEWLLKARDDAE